MAEVALFLSHTGLNSTFRVGSHHLAREFQQMGWRVVHLSSPYSFIHHVKNHGRPRRWSGSPEILVTDEGFIDCVPRPLLPASVLWTRSQLESLLDMIGVGVANVTLVDQPTLEVRSARLGKIVYRPTDVYHGAVKRLRERRLLSYADGVVATSRAVLDHLALDRALPTMVLPNGVDLDRFLSHQTNRRAGVVYVGAIDERFDFDAVSLIAETWPDLLFDIYGPLPASRLPRLPANVLFHGAVRYEDVPEILSRARIGLLPFRSFGTDSKVVEANRGRSPMKLFEYLAAGLFTVGSSLGEADLGTGAGCYYYSNYDELSMQFRRAVEFASRSVNMNGIDIARRNSWAYKARQLDEFVRSL